MPAHAFDKTLRARAGLHRRRGRGRREAGAVGGIPRHKDREAEGRARGFLRDRQAVRIEDRGSRMAIFNSPSSILDLLSSTLVGGYGCGERPRETSTTLDEDRVQPQPL